MTVAAGRYDRSPVTCPPRLVRPRARSSIAGGVGAVVLILAACGDDVPDGYSAATEAVFLETCAAGLGTGEVAVCECTYDTLVAETPFEEYLALDREVRDDPTTVPPALQAIAVTCAAEALSPPAPTRTTTPNRSETID